MHEAFPHSIIQCVIVTAHWITLNADEDVQNQGPETRGNAGRAGIDVIRTKSGLLDKTAHDTLGVFD
jgi:hypothetical protein